MIINIKRLERKLSKEVSKVLLKSFFAIERIIINLDCETSKYNSISIEGRFGSQLEKEWDETTDINYRFILDIEKGESIQYICGKFNQLIYTIMNNYNCEDYK